MPKWAEYTSKDTLADNDEVMLYDATAKANKRGLMSKFWDYVVDKMATAVISKLETDNQTIIGAINALNGNISIRSITELPLDTNTMYPINIEKDIIVGETTITKYSKGFYLAVNDAVFIVISYQLKILFGFRSNGIWRVLSTK